MVFRKNQKRPYRRRKRNLRRKRKAISRMPLNGFPTTKRARLRYCETIWLDSGAGSLAYHNFGANCLFDPNITGIGHQPRGFDQWMAQYNKAYVVGSKISITPIITSTSNVTPGAFGVVVGDDPAAIAAYGDFDDLIESRAAGTSSRNYRMAGTIYRQNASANRVTRFYSARKHHGKIIGNPHHQNTASTNPTEQTIFSVWQAAVGANNPGAQYYQVTIDFLVVFKEPNHLSQS